MTFTQFSKTIKEKYDEFDTWKYWKEDALKHWWYKKCKKHKALDWIDDHIVWYVWTKPHDWYLTVRHWIRCNFNHYHWRLVKQAWCSYPWDGSFILELEERQIDKQLYWFEHHQAMVDEQYNEIMRSLRWAKYCVHVLNNECDYFHYDGDHKFVPQVRDNNGELVDGPEEMEEAELYRMDMSNCHYVYDGPYVNKRNARRFVSKQLYESEWFQKDNHLHEYYMAKCRHLYYLIRERCTDLWWD